MSRPKKQYSDHSGDYSETIKHSILMCSNVVGNNNKFYSLELQKSKSGEYALFSHYGRITGNVVSGGIYEKRDPYYSELTAIKEFEKIVKKKKKGKKKVRSGVDYIESYEEVDVVSSNVGSSNIKNKTSVTSTQKGRLKTDVFKDFGKLEQIILKQLEEENIHDITNSTTLTYSSNGGLQTPLGPLTVSHLSKAKVVLDKISNEVNDLKSKNVVPKDLKFLNNEYLSLIPRNMGNRIIDSDLIITGDKVLREYDLLTQMETTIQITDMKGSDTPFDIGFDFINVTDKGIFNQIKNQIEKTRKHRNLSRYKVKNIFEVENRKERLAFETYADILQGKRPKGNQNHKLDYKEVDLFHGSRNSNILSILMNGFYVPPRNAPHVTGRMFGNGVYGADLSTKALNYSAGTWGGRSNKTNSIYCFVSRFALGKVKEASRALKTGTPSGFDSIYAPGGADLQNNEYIVPKPEQTTISYLVEFQ